MSVKHEIYWLSEGSMLQDKYRIDGVIEEGGMGIVYLGFDTVLDISVSIKEYFPRRFAMRNQKEKEIRIYKGSSETYFQEGLDKFIREARAMAKFREVESIVMVRDFFRENHTAYIVMDYVPGDNVKKYVEEYGPMPPEQVLEIMEPILCSLGKIHKEGLLHRDISPDNIVLNKNGKAVLIDFGASRITDENETKTMTIFFKRGYSAEEQYVEKSKRGSYTDIYALCATMYFMLTGIRPEESIRRLIRDEVKPLTKFKEIPLNEQAKEAIVKGMAVKMKDRYATIEKLYQDLYIQRESRNYRKILIGGLCAGTVLVTIFRISMQGKKEHLAQFPIQQNVPYVVTEAAVGNVSPAVVNAISQIKQPFAINEKKAKQPISVTPTPTPSTRRQEKSNTSSKREFAGELPW